MSGFHAAEREFNRLIEREDIVLKVPTRHGSGFRLLGLSDMRRQGRGDVVWRALLRAARRDGEPWITVGLGVALPRLKNVVSRRNRHPNVDCDDLTADVIGEAILMIRKNLQLRAPRVETRLIKAVDYAAQRHIYRRIRDTHACEVFDETDFVPQIPGSHPERVLVDAIQAGVLSDREAEIVARSRLEHRPLLHVTHELGVSYSYARRLRRDAEQRLGVWLADVMRCGFSQIGS